MCSLHRYCTTGPKDAGGGCDPLASPQLAREACKAVYPSSSLAPCDGVSQTIKAFRSGSTTPDLTMVLGRCEVPGAVWVGSSWDQDPQIVGFQSLHYSVSPRVRNSMPDLPCPASGHEAHLCVCLSLPVKRDLSLPLHAPL